VTRRRRLGLLGPAIVILGALVAGVGAWAIVTGRPTPGEVIDTIAVDANTTLIVRAEAGGERNFVELVHDGELKWQSLVPPYAGRTGVPGIAWGMNTVTVRVIRDQRAEIFAVALSNASKLGGFKLAPGKGPVVRQTSGPVTLTDHERSYEFVAGVGWQHLVAIDLGTGQGLWKQDLAGDPIEDAGIGEGVVWLRQRGLRRSFRLLDGSEESTPERSTKHP